MRDKKTIREHLQNGELYFSKKGPAPQAWKQLLLSKLAFERSLQIRLNAPRDWRVIAAVCIPLCFVFFGVAWLDIADPIQILEQATTVVSEMSSDLDVESGLIFAVIITIATFLWRGRLPDVLTSYF